MADRTTPARRVNLLGVVLGLIFLGVAGMGFSGNPWWVISAATKWTLAGLVAVVGVGLVVSALPRGRRSRR